MSAQAACVRGGGKTGQPSYGHLSDTHLRCHVNGTSGILLQTPPKRLSPPVLGEKNEPNRRICQLGTPLGTPTGNPTSSFGGSSAASVGEKGRGHGGSIPHRILHPENSPTGYLQQTDTLDVRHVDLLQLTWGAASGRQDGSDSAVRKAIAFRDGENAVIACGDDWCM